MKVAELRIGNYVYDTQDHCNITIVPIDFQGNNMFTPIPLTEEWLLKFGFDIEYTKGGFLRWQKGEFKLLDRRLPYPQFHSPKACIEYVHSLQNLYFALTNTELTIK